LKELQLMIKKRLVAAVAMATLAPLTLAASTA
jgi:hypothetical protein